MNQETLLFFFFSIGFFLLVVIDCVKNIKFQQRVLHYIVHSRRKKLYYTLLKTAIENPYARTNYDNSTIFFLGLRKFIRILYMLQTFNPASSKSM